MRSQPHHHRFIGDRAGGPGDDTLYQRPLAADPPEDAGWFCYYFDEDRWEWSPEVQRMHGYEPGTVIPTTELVLAHKFPGDQRQIADTIDTMRRTRQPFTSRHRIRDTAGAVHHVIVVADQLRDQVGTVIGTHGYYIDVTPTLAARQQQVTAAVAEISENRGVIEQAKGMLMAVYGVGAEEAFKLLRWVSQKNNVKLRLLAEQITTEFASLSHNGQVPPRSTYDNLLMTAHERVACRRRLDA